MKILAFIMAFLVLALSIMPCADGGDVNEAKVKTELANSTHHEDAAPDDCSPFCQCTCCSGFSISHFIVSITAISIPKSELLTSCLHNDTLDVALPIWQPPQLI